MHDTQRGFTLIELMVTITIISILTAIAIPIYEAYRKRGYEAVAMSYLRSWAPAQELYLQANGTYASADEDLDGLFVPTNVPYTFSIDSGSGTERWWGRATPTTGGLSYMYIDQTAVVRSSLSGPPPP